jgi:hypothetical protein
MLAKAIAMSACVAANSATASFETCGLPVNFSSTVNTTQPILRVR